MARIAYKPTDIAEPADLVESIRARRGGRLLNLDRLLLYSPPLAGGWNALLRAARTELSLSPRLRELAICAVAVLNDAEYEFLHHAPELIDAGGTQAQLDALRRLAESDTDMSAFDPAERAVIQLTAEMTRNVRVSDETFAAAKAQLPNGQQVVELVGIVAAYNMVSRFLVALEVEPER